MQVSEASWQVSAKLRRVNWLLAAERVEAKLQALRRAVKANFDPNQPRVPAGNPDGGQWTGTGGGAARLAQNVPPEDERDFEEETPAQSVRLAAANADAQELIRRVREIDPTWSPRRSLIDPNNIETQIAAAEGERDEAQARLGELSQASPEDLIDAFRQRDRDLFGDELLSHGDNVVAVCKVNGLPSFGVNSDAPASFYSDRDSAAALGMRTAIKEDNPAMAGQRNIGQMPFNALFHAETTSLLRAARANGGTLEGQEVEVYVDGQICNNCRRILPLVTQRLGNPTVRLRDRRGYFGTIRSGKWVPEDGQ